MTMVLTSKLEYSKNASKYRLFRWLKRGKRLGYLFNNATYTVG